MAKLENVSAPPSPSPFIATFETGRHYQVHKSYIWLGPIVAVFAVVFATLINGMQGWIQLATAIQDGELQVNPFLVIGLILLALVVFIGLFIGLYTLAWRNMSYVFDEREFSFYSGIITKRRVHVPYARVQSVNHRASLIQRVFGVCTVAIDSAGGASNKAVRVPYVTLETAERMRGELFMRKAAVGAGMEASIVYAPHADSTTPEAKQAEAARRQWELSQAPVPPGVVPGAVPGAAPGAAPKSGAPNALDAAVGSLGDWRGVYGGTTTFGEEPVSYEHGLSNHELLLTTISHDKPIVVAFVVFVAFVVTFAFMLLAQDEVSRTILLFVFPIVAGSTLFTWIIGLLGVLVSYGNFRTRRRGSRIEVERGLLARDFSGIDIERVQSIEVRQSFVRRIIGYCELSLGRIDSASEQNKGNNKSAAASKGLVIHPFVRIDRVDEILDGLVPELADRPRRVECQQLPKAAMRRAILRRCVWFNWALWVAVAIGICWAVIGALVNAGTIHFASAGFRAQYDQFMVGSLVIVSVLAVGLTVARAVGAVLWARHSGYVWNRDYLLLWNDGLSTEQSVIPRKKIQSAVSRSNPFQRRLSLATLQAVTAAGAHSTVARLVDVPAEIADAYLDWLKPRTH